MKELVSRFAQAMESKDRFTEFEKSGNAALGDRGQVAWIWRVESTVIACSFL